MKAYIEAHDDEVDNFSIEISCQDALLAKSDCSPRAWIYTVTNDDGDLVINNSQSMEDNKWDHITNEIVGYKGEHVWEI